MTNIENNELEKLRHSASHLMAHAVAELFPETKLAIGPAIENGFYYDFDGRTPFTPEDLEKIEKKMREIGKQNLRIERYELTKQEAREFYSKKSEKYKLELLDDIAAGKVYFYRQGGFTDMCAGPHIASTEEIKHFKLLSIAGAYWRGDSTKPMLQRIYGTAFFKEEDLKDYLNNLAEAEKRDHRKIGKNLDLFSISDGSGSGLVLYHPKGSLLRQTIEDFEKEEHAKRGYEYVYTPHIYKADIWKTSGHYVFYHDKMYFLNIEDQEYGLKPMNCPGHVMIYNSRLRSYRDLPIRYFELGTVYRHELSGTMHGLLRVRGFTQDDAHIFCTPDQIKDEVFKVLDFALFMMKTFGFSEYEIYLSTRPEKSIGSDENWERATNSLREALTEKGLKYDVDPGEGVFYGPKIDIKIKDCLGRSFQGPTIQVDFNFPEKFNLCYVDKDGARKQPVMIHRTVLGSMERFIGLLIEQYAGALPAWLSPVQVRILTVADRHMEYAEKIRSILLEKSVRTEVDSRNEKIGLKIRESQLEKIPYMLIVGDKEIASANVSLRTREKGDQGAIGIDKLLEDITARIRERT